MKKYKKRYDQTEVKLKWQILEKKMIYVGKFTWVIHSAFDNPKERDFWFKQLNSEEYT